MAHLSKLQDEFGRKGLNVLSITNEKRDTVLKFLAQINASPMTYTIGLEGGHGNFPSRGIPAAWLIGADGKVVWQGNPGGLSDKVIEEELRKVKVTAEMKAARGEKALAYAETLVGQKNYLRAVGVLNRVTKELKGTEAAKKAEERVAALDKDEAVKKEITAQKELERLVTGLEAPKEKLKEKERLGKAAQLEGFIKKNQEAAPGAVELANAWIKVMQEEWKRESN